MLCSTKVNGGNFFRGDVEALDQFFPDDIPEGFRNFPLRPDIHGGQRLPVVLFALVEFEDETDPEYREQEVRPYVFSAVLPGDPDAIWDATEASDYCGWAPE